MDESVNAATNDVLFVLTIKLKCVNAIDAARGGDVVDASC